jgi:hypothetical protein
MYAVTHVFQGVISHVTVTESWKKACKAFEDFTGVPYKEVENYYKQHLDDKGVPYPLPERFDQTKIIEIEME